MRVHFKYILVTFWYSLQHIMGYINIKKKCHIHIKKRCLKEGVFPQIELGGASRSDSGRAGLVFLGGTARSRASSIALIPVPVSLALVVPAPVSSAALVPASRQQKPYSRRPGAAVPLQRQHLSGQRQPLSGQL